MPHSSLTALCLAALLTNTLAGCASPSQPTGQPALLAEVVNRPPISRPECPPQTSGSDQVADSRGPSNDRDWIDEHRLLAHANFEGDQVRLHNIRHAEFFSYRDCLVDYYDKTFDLSQIRTV